LDLDSVFIFWEESDTCVRGSVHFVVDSPPAGVSELYETENDCMRDKGSNYIIPIVVRKCLTGGASH